MQHPIFRHMAPSDRAVTVSQKDSTYSWVVLYFPLLLGSKSFKKLFLTGYHLKFLGRQREWEHLPETSKTTYRRLAHLPLSAELSEQDDTRDQHFCGRSCMSACKGGLQFLHDKEAACGAVPTSPHVRFRQAALQSGMLLSLTLAARSSVPGFIAMPTLSALRQSWALLQFDGCGTGIPIQLSQITTGTGRG